MERYSYMGITGEMILDTRREKENEQYPIKYRLTYKRKSIYFNTGLDLSEDDWTIIETARKKAVKDTKEKIQSFAMFIKKHCDELCREGKFSIETLNQRLGKGSTSNIFELFANKVEKLKNEGKVGTAEWYYYSSKSLLKYINNDIILNRKKKKTDKAPLYEKKELKFNTVTPDWLRKYEKWLLSCGKKYTSISMFMRGLQAIFNNAKELGIINEHQYPFGKGKYERPEGEGRKMALTLKQINDLMNYPLVDKYELRSRDLFFFSYLCNGINVNDMLRLKYSNIHDDEISYYRAKTIEKSRKKSEIRAILLPQMIEIIERWGNPVKSPDSFIFPYFNNTKNAFDEKRVTRNVIKLMNDHLKKIAKEIGIGNISSYTARHSFATVLKRSGANISMISELLGHTDMKTTENYLASFEKDERIKNANLLTQFE